MKKNIVISIMTIALSTALLAGCGQQNVEPTPTTAPETEITAQIEEPTQPAVEEPEVIEEPVVEEPEIVEEPETDTSERPEIVAQGYVSCGPLMDYADDLTCVWDNEVCSMLHFQDDGFMNGTSTTYDFTTEEFEFQGITQNDTPEDMLYKCVELFGMPSVYSTEVSNMDYYAEWYFDAPTPGVFNGNEEDYVSLVVSVGEIGESYQVKMVTSQFSGLTSSMLS